jgi:DHA1 family bicyclomycin/chloramphenicol resistance-like MFS transporter
VFFAIREVRGPDPSFSLLPRDILCSFGEVFREPQFLTYAVSGGVAFAGLFVFVSSSPFLFLKLYGISEKQYGVLFAIMVGCMIMVSQANRFLLHRYSSEQLVAWAISIQVAMSFLLLAVALLNAETFYVHVVLLTCFLATVGIILPNASALTLAPFSSNTGTASSMMGVLQLGFGALASFIVSVYTIDSAMPMTVAMVICATCALVCLLVGRPYIQLKYSSSAGSSSLH